MTPRSEIPPPDGWGAELLVVIVCYRVPDLTIECLRSIAPEVATVPGVHVAVVENGTGGDSAERIRDAIRREGWEKWTSFFEIHPNRGFAGGNNYVLRRELGARHPSRYVLLLNADTVVHPGCLKYCYDLMNRRPEIGTMSCRFVDREGRMQNVARLFPRPDRMIACTFSLPWRWPRLFGRADTEDPGWDRDTEARAVEWVGGGFMLIRGEVLQKVGILDEDFVFYGEDIEYCHRVAKAGYVNYYDPAVSITHYGGGSNDEVYWSSTVRDAHTWRSRYLVQRKCYGRAAAWALRTADLAAWTLRALWLFLTGRGKTERGRVALGNLLVLLRPIEKPGPRKT